jgi:hypothetical protein
MPAAQASLFLPSHGRLRCAAQAPSPSSGPASGTQLAGSGGLQPQLSRPLETPASHESLDELQVDKTREVREEEPVGQLRR